MKKRYKALRPRKTVRSSKALFVWLDNPDFIPGKRRLSMGGRSKKRSLSRRKGGKTGP